MQSGGHTKRSSNYQRLYRQKKSISEKLKFSFELFCNLFNLHFSVTLHLHCCSSALLFDFASAAAYAVVKSAFKPDSEFHIDNLKIHFLKPHLVLTALKTVFVIFTILYFSTDHFIFVTDLFKSFLQSQHDNFIESNSNSFLHT